MIISYAPLWALLAKHGDNKNWLREATGLSSGTIAKLAKNGNVTTDVRIRIREALNCGLSDIAETTDNTKDGTNVPTN